LRNTNTDISRTNFNADTNTHQNLDSYPNTDPEADGDQDADAGWTDANFATGFELSTGLYSQQCLEY